jgi:hypothetical protein
MLTTFAGLPATPGVKNGRAPARVVSRRPREEIRIYLHRPHRSHV